MFVITVLYYLNSLDFAFLFLLLLDIFLFLITIPFRGTEMAFYELMSR